VGRAEAARRLVEVRLDPTRHWEGETVHPDTNPLQHVVASDVPVLVMHIAGGRRVARSRRIFRLTVACHQRSKRVNEQHRQKEAGVREDACRLIVGQMEAWAILVMNPLVSTLGEGAIVVRRPVAEHLFIVLVVSRQRLLCKLVLAALRIIGSNSTVVGSMRGSCSSSGSSGGGGDGGGGGGWCWYGCRCGRRRWCWRWRWRRASRPP
jgi:uncharacterized membrane protein YgcG